MKKVIVINPRGIKGDEEYLDGMVRALYKRKDIQVILFTNYYYEMDDERLPYEVHRHFFRKSEKMTSSLKRKIIRVVEYILQYISLIRIIKLEKTDIIHIHWSVISQIDSIFWNKLKKCCKKLVYTAHNVLPHINSERYIKSYDKLYKCVDKIIVHGQSIYNEFSERFPQYIEKVYISRHGEKNSTKKAIDYSDPEVVKYSRYINNYEKLFLSFGMIYYEKGMDRLIRVWKELNNHNNTCLIIAGKSQPSYKELDELRPYAEVQKDLLLIDQFISNNLLDFFVDSADLIILPYRHASMSGVMFTAAAAAVPVLCTDVGSLSEYMTNECGWIVDNTDESIKNGVRKVLTDFSNNDLNRIGQYFQNYIVSEYNWDTIVDGIVKDCY